jgi:hypothetical protein
MMSSEPDLPALLAGRGAQTILCAGNGLSGEALALALHGFSVTALDISTVPGAFWKDLDPEHPIRRFPGFKLRDDGSVSFDVAGPLDPAFGPPMHRSPDYPPRGGGSLSYVAGDLIDPKICPGPYDVVIERRTLQLFPKIDQLLGLHRLVDRLATSGILVTHQHKGNWRPGEDRIHFAEAWLTDHGFVVTDAFQDSGAARLACVVFSTG